MNAKIIFLFLILLLVPFVSARERLNLNVDINSWCSEDNTSISRFNMTLNGNERNLDIDDEANYVKNDVTTNWNGSVTLRFDSSNTTDFCSGDMESLVNNITNICQTKTEELADARKFLEDGKAACESNLVTCNTDKGTLKTKSDSYDTMLGNYNNCYAQLTNQTSLLTDCQKQQDNMWLYLIGACLLGGLIGFFGKEKIQKTKKSLGGGRSVEEKESPHSLPPED
ncbi:MAG: hypothetical protein AABY07_00015 [Nanoarchaeota archaeon]